MRLFSFVRSSRSDGAATLEVAKMQLQNSAVDVENTNQTKKTPTVSGQGFFMFRFAVTTPRDAAHLG